MMSECKLDPGDGSTPVFGLSKAQLYPIVEAATGEPIASFDISIEHQVEGYYGFGASKVIPTFTYVTSAGRSGRVTVFAKHSHNPKSTEAEQYGFLAAHDAHIPQLYGVLHSPAGRVVLFLEYVDTSEAARSTGPTECLQELLSLMACFNTIRPTSEYAAWLQQEPSRWKDGVEPLKRTQELLWEHASRGDLGDELQQFCTLRQDDLSRLQAFTDRLSCQAAEMETGLVHNDFSRENTGRRPTGERVVMDLELVSSGPRFIDVSEWLGIPEKLWARQESPRDLGEYYLREYARWGGCPPPLDQCLEEARALWVYELIMDLGFGFDNGRQDSSADQQVRRGCRRGLLSHLTMLLDWYC